MWRLLLLLIVSEARYVGRNNYDSPSEKEAYNSDFANKYVKYAIAPKTNLIPYDGRWNFYGPFRRAANATVERSNPEETRENQLRTLDPEIRDAQFPVKDDQIIPFSDREIRQRLENRKDLTQFVPFTHLVGWNRPNGGRETALDILAIQNRKQEQPFDYHKLHFIAENNTKQQSGEKTALDHLPVNKLKERDHNIVYGNKPAHHYPEEPLYGYWEVKEGLPPYYQPYDPAYKPHDLEYNPHHLFPYLPKIPRRHVVVTWSYHED